MSQWSDSPIQENSPVSGSRILFSIFAGSSVKKRFLISILITAFCFCGTTAHCFDDDPALSTDGLHASIQHEVDSPDWVKALPAAQDPDTRQLFIAAGLGPDQTAASISMHERDENGSWKQILSTPGFIGLNGMVRDAEHREGCAQTPIGTYRFNKAFGLADDPGCSIPYIKADEYTWWSGDDREGMHYNEMIDIREFPDLDKTNSEHITDYEYQYQYCLNISFNEEGAPGRGSAIFLHCLGPLKPYTGGCIAVPENIMMLIMQKVSADCVVVIDTLESLGGYF